MRSCILSADKLKETLHILSLIEIEVKKKHSDDKINPNGEMSIAEIRKALIIAQESEIPIFILAERAQSHDKTLSSEHYKGWLLPPHLHPIDVIQSKKNCWFLAVIDSLLMQPYGPKMIASLIIDLEQIFVLENKKISLAQLLGLENKNVVMVRLIKDGIPRYCICYKERVIEKPYKNYSKFYIEAIEHAYTGLFYGGDYSKVKPNFIIAGYSAFLYEKADQIRINPKLVRQELQGHFSEILRSSSILNHDQKKIISDIFKGNEKLIQIFQILRSKIIYTKKYLSISSIEGFCAAIASLKLDELKIDEPTCKKLISDLEKFESHISSNEEFSSIHLEKVSKIMSINPGGEIYTMCVSFRQIEGKPILQKDGLLRKHAYAIQKIVKNLEFSDLECKSTLKADVIFMKNPWGNKKLFNKEGQLLDISDCKYGVGIKNSGGQLTFFNSRDSVSQITIDFLIENDGEITYVPKIINENSADELSRESITRLYNNMVAEKEAALLAEKEAAKNSNSWSFLSIFTGKPAAPSAKSSPHP